MLKHNDQNLQYEITIRFVKYFVLCFSWFSYALILFSQGLMDRPRKLFHVSKHSTLVSSLVPHILQVFFLKILSVLCQFSTAVSFFFAFWLFFTLASLIPLPLVSTPFSNANLFLTFVYTYFVHCLWPGIYLILGL